MLCCIHHNTFHENATKKCIHPHMGTLHIKYHKVYPSGVGYNHTPGIKCVVERTVCMPFSPLELEVLTARTSEDGLSIILSSSKNPEEYTLNAKQLHTLDSVIRDMESVKAYQVDDVSYVGKALQEGKRPHKKNVPKTTNISGKAFPCASECIISHEAKKARMCEQEKSNINKGQVVNAAGFKAIISTSSIEILAATNITDALKFLERFCNVDVNRPPLVHNVIINARLPHSTLMHPGGDIKSSLHFYADYQVDQKCISQICECPDMLNSQINLKVHDWDRVARILERDLLHGEATPTILEYKSLKETMDPSSISILMKTSAKVKVTHFGAVMIIFSWPKPDSSASTSNENNLGPLPWSSSNTRMVHTMVIMLLQMLELCS